MDEQQSESFIHMFISNGKDDCSTNMIQVDNYKFQVNKYDNLYLYNDLPPHELALYCYSGTKNVLKCIKERLFSFGQLRILLLEPIHWCRIRFHVGTGCYVMMVGLYPWCYDGLLS